MTTTSPATTIDVHRVAGHIGANITGVNLTQPLDPPTVATIRAALLTHKVIFFRDQHLTHAQHVTFARTFGNLTRRPGDLHGNHPDGFPQILTIDPHTEDERYGRDFEERYRQKWTTYTAGWHTDLTPAINPPAISILRAERVPDYGGDTHWTNLVAAYNGLSAPLRALADRLQAEHTFFAGCQLQPADPEDIAIRARARDNAQVSIHPVVRVHPETGEHALYVHPASVNRIIGLTPTESRHLLDAFFAQTIRPEYTVRFRWQTGSIAIWDNRATAHLAATDLNHLNVRRTMHRVTILGDRPVGPDGFVSQAVAGHPLTPFTD